MPYRSHKDKTLFRPSYRLKSFLRPSRKRQQLAG
jgi:hypothetical protein